MGSDHIMILTVPYKINLHQNNEVIYKKKILQVEKTCTYLVSIGIWCEKDR